MAFKNQEATNVSPFQPNQGKEQAEAYINIRIPVTKDDGTISKSKLAATPLMMSKPMHEQLIELFRENPEDAAERLKEALIIDFQENTSKSGNAGKLLI